MTKHPPFGYIKPGLGLLYLIATVEPQEGGPEARYHGAPRLGPRAFSISLENSFGDNFVWMYISTHAPILS